MTETLAAILAIYLMIGIIAALSLTLASGLRLRQVKLSGLAWIVFCWPRLWSMRG